MKGFFHCKCCQLLVSGAILINLIIFSLVVSQGASAEQKQPNIIIVGAGASGIAAATRLIENGFTNVKILEAENRIGGRVYSVTTGNWTVDIGGHWVHGESGNVVYDMAAPLGLLDNSTKDYTMGAIVFSDKEETRSDLLEVLQNPEFELFNRSLLEKRNDSLEDYIRDVLTPVLRQRLNGSERVDAYMDWITKVLCTAEGCDTLKDVSAKGYLHYVDISGSSLVGWKGKGYKSAIDLLLKRHEKSTGTPISLEGILHLNKEVTSISKDNGVTVKCKDGSSFTADLVIVTVSLGVLKADHETLFHPPLPEDKKRVIKGLGIGTIDKVILRFPHIWWPSQISEFVTIWLEKDRIKENGESPWEEEILSFNTEDGSPFTLTAWVIGEAGRKMETQSIEEVKNRAMRVLRKFLGHEYSIPEPVEVLRSTWGTNPHFRGSYSYRSMASEALNVNHADLAKPVTDENGKEVILFAGEASNTKGHYSTVHGAIETGWREADRIIKMYK